MYGGPGNDTYVLSAASNDVVVELVREGPIDTVFTPKLAISSAV